MGRLALGRSTTPRPSRQPRGILSGRWFLGPYGRPAPMKPTVDHVRMLIRAEVDADGFIVIPRWAAEASRLGDDQRRIAVRPDGSPVLAHLAPQDAVPCRAPSGDQPRPSA